MRKYFYTALIAALIMAFVAPAIVYSADSILTAKISSMVEKADKNGKPYVRFIVNETRSLAGVNYNTGVPVMAFGETVQQARKYNTGDTLKAVVKHREYQGRESYTVLAFIEPDN